MNIKRIWLILPAALLPYVILGALVTIFFSSSRALEIFIYVIKKIFFDNMWLFVLAIWVYTFIALTLSLICVLLAIFRKWDGVSLAKTAMIIKIAQFPAHLLIIVLSFIFLNDYLHNPIWLCTFYLECFNLAMTLLLFVASVITAIRAGLISLKWNLKYIVLQLFFCTDVVAAILFYRKLKGAALSEEKK